MKSLRVVFICWFATACGSCTTRVDSISRWAKSDTLLRPHLHQDALLGLRTWILSLTSASCFVRAHINMLIFISVQSITVILLLCKSSSVLRFLGWPHQYRLALSLMLCLSWSDSPKTGCATPRLPHWTTHFVLCTPFTGFIVLAWHSTASIM